MINHVTFVSIFVTNVAPSVIVVVYTARTFMASNITTAFYATFEISVR